MPALARATASRGGGCGRAGGGVGGGVGGGAAYLQAVFAALVMASAVAGVGILPGLLNGNQRDAVHRAGGQAQLAAGTSVGQYLVLKARGADDGIDRTGEDALGAADAVQRVDVHDMPHGHGVEIAGKRQRRASEQLRQGRDGGVAAGRAPVDGGLAAGDGLRVGVAVVVAAAPALGLRQQLVDVVDEGSGSGHRRGWGCRGDE